jgi:hypothetical protein
MKATEQKPTARVAPARKLISKPRDLIAQAEGRHVAMLVLRFGERVFQGDEKPTPTADVVVVDIEANPPRLLASLSISWRRVVPALRLVEPNTWQVGRLVREEEYQAVELLEPDKGFDLERAAARLGELEAAGTGRLGQLALPLSNGEGAEGGSAQRLADDDGAQ